MATQKSTCLKLLPTNKYKNCAEIMRERLLNPKRLNIELEALQITIIDGVSYRTFTKQYSTTDDGSCQCYKDCDCSSRAGKVTNTETTWYRNIKFDGTDKCFYSEPYTQKEYCL